MTGLTAGAARTDITPASLDGLDAMTGGFTGVHDPLFCRAVVIDDGVASVAVISLDLLEVGSSGALRQRISTELGIDAARVLLAASHTHTAPRVGRTPAGGLSRPPTAESLAYTEVVFDAIVATVASAQAALRPARVGFGRGAADVNLNRDELRDGSWVLGQNPEGPSDKSVRVVSLVDDDGAAIATLASYAVHPTVSLGTKLIGADLAGAAARTAEAQLGGLVLWLPGSIGDQTPRHSAEHDAADRIAEQTDAIFGWVDEQGAEVGQEIARVAHSIENWQDATSVAGSEIAVPFPARRGSNLAADMTQDEVSDIDVRLTVLQLGDIALLGIGGEVTTPAAELIAAASPLESTVLVSIANERLGYLADDNAFERGTFAARGCPVQQGWDTAVASAVARVFAQGEA